MGFGTDKLAVFKKAIKAPFEGFESWSESRNRRQKTRRAKKELRILHQKPLPSTDSVVYYASFQPGPRISEFVFLSLEAWTKTGTPIIFISTSPEIVPEDLSRLESFCHGVVHRVNLGYDFFSWKAGWKAFMPPEGVTTVYWTNDSVYGPLVPLRPWLDRVSASSADVVGMTDSWGGQYHLQSYFLAFQNKALSAGWMAKFLEAIEVVTNKTHLISHYEVGLTQKALRDGLSVESLVDYRELYRKFGEQCLRAGFDPDNPHHYNPTFVFWKPLVTEGLSPFLKVALVRENPLRTNQPGQIDELWRQGTLTLPLSSIVEHQKLTSQGGVF